MSREHLVGAGLSAAMLLACGGTDAVEAAETQTLLRDYHGLDEGASWTYRDDGSDEDPEDSALLYARLVDEEAVELRRGSRWAEAEVVGELVWDLGDGLELVAWDVLGHQGEGSLRVADFAPEHGDRHSSGDWICVTNGNTEEVDTFYGIFDDVLRFECASDDASEPAGTWDFARHLGLVRYESADGGVLDLVAPY